MLLIGTHNAAFSNPNIMQSSSCNVRRPRRTFVALQGEPRLRRVNQKLPWCGAGVRALLQQGYGAEGLLGCTGEWKGIRSTVIDAVKLVNFGPARTSPRCLLVSFRSETTALSVILKVHFRCSISVRGVYWRPQNTWCMISAGEGPRLSVDHVSERQSVEYAFCFLRETAGICDGEGAYVSQLPKFRSRKFIEKGGIKWENQGAVGDLTKFSQRKENYRTQYEHASCLFTPESRPQRVRLLYEQAAATPALHVIRGLADDGVQDSPRRLFLCMPVWGDAASTRSRNLDLDIETRRPASLLSGQDARDSGGEDLLTLPSPEEKMHALSLEYPAVVVPIDTSESSFNRLSSVRRSLIHVDFLIKRKKHHKRRNTISDGNSKEIAEALTNRKKSGTLVKTEALIHSSCQTDDDLLRTTTTTKTTAAKSGNNRSSSAGGILSKRRTEESPSSSGELSSSSSTTTETNVNSKPESKRSSFYEAMNFSRLGRDWKFLKKSSSSKKETAAAADGAAAKNEASRVAESGTCTGGSEKKKRTASLLPISTNSGAMTVAVKLRETIGAHGGQEGQRRRGGRTVVERQLEREQQHPRLR
ncbi:hypothetical protein HPB48_007168 [Haemaphysalis longicornis]|uniref:Uncharacterized protein n=1 Tax=Haemaphysalis longicornis TaxID=44386 RepID=A0A9J6H4W5_HAELO|nr:hypothetical protein HPB48_007168 [Haemaphysalis longicornis]